jgi:hypothetical protein
MATLFIDHPSASTQGFSPQKDVGGLPASLHASIDRQDAEELEVLRYLWIFQQNDCQATKMQLHPSQNMDFRLNSQDTHSPSIFHTTQPNDASINPFSTSLLSTSLANPNDIVGQNQRPKTTNEI